MTERNLEPCPFLPMPSRRMSAADTKKLGGSRDAVFYRTALEYAQSLWLERLPARALLLLNRAMGADLGGEEEVLGDYPIPYRAVIWILRNRLEEDFIGNPRRHWQHLATRMSGPRPDLRTWRAWACWALAREALPDFPADEKQIREEGIVEPSLEEISASLEKLGFPGEVEEWKGALESN